MKKFICLVGLCAFVLFLTQPTASATGVNGTMEAYENSISDNEGSSGGQNSRSSNAGGNKATTQSTASAAVEAATDSVEKSKPEEPSSPNVPDGVNGNEEENQAAVQTTNNATPADTVSGLVSNTRDGNDTLLGVTQGTVDTPNNNNTSQAEQDYADAKERETSTANRMLSGLTMAATGIGGMQLAQGLAEQSADAAAQQAMQGYMTTFQCKVGNGGNSYTGGTMGIETPGANQLINLYQEYIDLAGDLKERKNSLGLRPGIESEVILDKAYAGLYDDAGHGIANGTYASIYRAARGNEKDNAKLQEQKDASANRVKFGAIAAGAGVVGGMVGNAIINKDKKIDSKTKKVLNKEKDSLDSLKTCLKAAGVPGADNLQFDKFFPSALKIDNLTCTRERLLKTPSNPPLTAQDCIPDSTDAYDVYNSLENCFSGDAVKAMIGAKSDNEYEQKQALNSAIQDAEEEYDEAEEDDILNARVFGIQLSRFKPFRSFCEKHEIRTTYDLEDILDWIEDICP